jgi:hypothetical protein
MSRTIVSTFVALVISAAAPAAEAKLAANGTGLTGIAPGSVPAGPVTNVIPPSGETTNRR